MAPAKRKRAVATDPSSEADAAWLAASDGSEPARVEKCARELLSELWRRDRAAAKGILDRCLACATSQRQALHDLLHSTRWILHGEPDARKAIGHLDGESVNVNCTTDNVELEWCKQRSVGRGVASFTGKGEAMSYENVTDDFKVRVRVEVKVTGGGEPSVTGVISFDPHRVVEYGPSNAFGGELEFVGIAVDSRAAKAAALIAAKAMYDPDSDPGHGDDGDDSDDSNDSDC